MKETLNTICDLGIGTWVAGIGVTITVCGVRLILEALGVIK